MNDLMLHTAQELSNEEAGGHGDRWGVFAGGFETAIRRLLTTVEMAEVVAGIVDKAATEAVVAAGEPKGVLLLYTGREKGHSKTGAMSLVVQDPETGGNELWSAYPFFGDGAEVDSVVYQLLLHPNHLEATLEIGLADGALIRAFDPLFCQHRALYKAGESYRFSLSALAYKMGPSQPCEYVIDDPDRIRHFHAADAWVKKHGQWTKEEDEAAALVAWQPETPEDLEPIRIDASQTTAIWPTGFSDDAGYMGEVVCVTPEAVQMFDTFFWRVDVALVREEYANLTVPIYVAENLFEGDWRPIVGKYVTGSLWMQAYAKALR